MPPHTHFSELCLLDGVIKDLESKFFLRVQNEAQLLLPVHGLEWVDPQDPVAWVVHIVDAQEALVQQDLGQSWSNDFHFSFSVDEIEAVNK